MNINLNKLAFSILCSCAAVVAQASDSHYVPGMEGVRGSVLPPPGVYYKGYYINYQADDAHIDLTVNALAHRFAWVTSQEILGANLAFETVLPMMRTDLKVDGQSIDKQTGVGDLYVGGILGWHGDRWDITAGTGYWADTGKYNQDKPASPGKGFDSVMLSLGGNAKLNQKGDITFSALGRYGMPNGSGLHDELIVEWGLGKDYGLYNFGLIGYNTFETGDGNERRNALGASLSYFSPKYKLGGDIAAYQEFSNKNTLEGSTLRASLTKAF